MNPAAVLFDAVGTLFGVRGSVGEVYARIAAEVGVSVDAAVLEGRFRAAFARRPAPTAASRTWWRGVVAETFAGVVLPDFEDYFERVWQHFATAEPWELYPETRPVLDGLRARGVALAVVSNFDERLHPVLAALDLARYFQAVIVSVELGFAKPDPRLFACALDALGVSADRALVVGDSGEDVRGAGAAGIAALRVARNGIAGPGTIPSLAALLGDQK